VLLRNQFGGTLGGAIWKDHTFFFGDYEGTRQVVHAIMQASVPTVDQDGTSALAIAKGGYTFLTAPNSQGVVSPVPLINPLTGQTYANGVIPSVSESLHLQSQDQLHLYPRTQQL
jgi:hypothetical protein